MNGQSRFSNNGVAVCHSPALLDADEQCDDGERPVATIGDGESAPGGEAACRREPARPFLNGKHGEKCDIGRQTATADDPRAYRDARGRFVKGNPGGPGNPHRRRVSCLRRAITLAISDQEVAELMKKLLHRANKGSSAAAKILLTFAVGRPTPAPDPDMDDIHEWQVNQQLCVRSTDFERMLNSMPADVACMLVDTMRPAALAKFRKDAVAALTGRPTPKRDTEGEPASSEV
jgi:hypothetical protein